MDTKRDMVHKIDIALAVYEDLQKEFGFPREGAIFGCLKAAQLSDGSMSSEMESYIQSKLGISIAAQRRLASQYDMLSTNIPEGASGKSSETLYRRFLKDEEQASTIHIRGPLLKHVNQSSHRIQNYLKHGGYRAAAKVLNDLTLEEIIEEVKDSKLRGRGGAYFPVGAKWEACLRTQSETRFLICNADEGEPPTRKDKVLLDHNPHQLLEGMIIAAKAIGARLGIIYIRGDYHESIGRVREAIREAENVGWLGKNIQSSGFDFDVHIFPGSGSYVAGCDTAMLESLEGKAAIPRPTPPFPTEYGLAGQASIVNNVETLCNIPVIFNMGAKAFSNIGVSDCPGTKIFGLCGDIASPGMYEMPIGSSLADIIEMAGGVVDIQGSTVRAGKLKAVSPGGVTTGLITAEEAREITMDPKSLAEKGCALGSGAIAIFNERNNMIEFALDVLEFLAEESCGSCMQCPISIKMTQRTLLQARLGLASSQDIQSISHRADMLPQILKCGLGKSSYSTARCAIEKFPLDI